MRMKATDKNPSGLGRAARALVAVHPGLLMAVWWMVMLPMLAVECCRRTAWAVRQCWLEARHARAAMDQAIKVELYVVEMAKVIRKGEPS